MEKIRLSLLNRPQKTLVVSSHHKVHIIKLGMPALIPHSAKEASTLHILVPSIDTKPRQQIKLGMLALTPCSTKAVSPLYFLVPSINTKCQQLT